MHSSPHSSLLPSYVYILANKKIGTLYTGVTSDLLKRISEHRQNLASGFTSKHNIHMLVYFETHHHIVNAIKREKQIKKWHRAWKIQLIEKENPNWDDLFLKLTAQPRSRHLRENAH
jgi:putative endonuclease